MPQEILYNVSGPVATVTLNRPERLNAWTRQMEEEFVAAITAASGDESTRAIVITGAGRGFCAGADMSLLNTVAASGSANEHERVTGEQITAGQHRHAWLLQVPKPIIAAINGPAVGLGFVIPLYCDFRIAAASAVFNTIFSRRGLIAEFGAAWMLPRLVGLPRAIDLLFTSRKFDAREALEIGLVQRVLPDEGFLPAVQAFAQELATTVSPRSLRVMKKQIYGALSQSLEDAVAASLEEMYASLASDDFKEGVAHFLEKREPSFTGR